MNNIAKDFKSGFKNFTLSNLTPSDKEVEHAAFMLPPLKVGFNNHLPKPSLKLSG